MSFNINPGGHPLGVGLLGVGINGQKNDYFGPQLTSPCINHHQDQKGGEAHRNIASGLISLKPLPLDGSVPSALSLKAINLPTACSALGLEEISRFDSRSTPLYALKKSKSQNEGPFVSFSFAIPASPTEEHVPQCPIFFVNATSPKEGNSPRCCTSFSKLTLGAPPVYQPTARTTVSALIPEPRLRAFTRHRQSRAKSAEKRLSSPRIASIIPSAYTSDCSDSLLIPSPTATTSSIVSDSILPISEKFLSMRDSIKSHSSICANSTCSDHKSVESHSRAFLDFQSLNILNSSSPGQASWPHNGVVGGVKNPRYNILKVGGTVDLKGFHDPAYCKDSVFDENAKSSANVPRSKNVALISTQIGINEFVDRTAMKTRNAMQKSSGPKSLVSESIKKMRANRGDSSIPSICGSFESMARTRANFPEKRASLQVGQDLSEENVEQAILRFHQIAGEVLARAHREILEKNRAFVNDLKLPELSMRDLQSGSSKPHLKESAGYVYGATNADALEDFSKNRSRRRKPPLISFSKVNKEKSNREPRTWTTEYSTSCSCFPSRFKSKNILKSLYQSAKHRKMSQAPFDFKSSKNPSKASTLCQKSDGSSATVLDYDVIQPRKSLPPHHNLPVPSSSSGSTFFVGQ